MDQRSNAPINLSIDSKEISVPNNVGLTIFRITQESLNNAIRHSNASEISVRLTEYPNKLRLSITDDGKGIEGAVDSTMFVSQGHFGLSGMRERAAMVGGKFQIHTARDYGTVIIFEWEKETE
jgi:signal transduction histidine kinase